MGEEITWETVVLYQSGQWYKGSAKRVATGLTTSKDTIEALEVFVLVGEENDNESVAKPLKKVVCDVILYENDRIVGAEWLGVTLMLVCHVPECVTVWRCSCLAN